jgi:L-amino acid N-acyltransferase YncA
MRVAQKATADAAATLSESTPGTRGGASPCPLDSKPLHISPWARHRGVARRAAAEATRWALENLGFASVELRAAVENTASRRVAEHLGFTLEGVMRSGVPSRIGHVDVASYNRLSSD